MCNDSVEILKAALQLKIYGRDMRYRKEYVEGEIINYFNEKIGLDLKNDHFNKRI